ncbi:MAG: hypothetical protein JXA94_04720 [Parachlamydiales bacterium]|nr:hypothetical protein [Parachlamydiales bacterium]
MYNNIYKGRYQEKNTDPGSLPSDTKLRINCALISLNMNKILDLNVILGSSDLQIDQEIYAYRRFAWGAGFKLVLCKYKNVFASFDGKYFQTDQKSDFFIIDKEVYPLKTAFKQTYEEYQGSLSISYPTKFLSPYIGATYLYSDITPTPKGGILILPGGSELDFDTNNYTVRKNFGMVVGTTISNLSSKATISIETRMFDQNAFAFVGQIRF